MYPPPPVGESGEQSHLTVIYDAAGIVVDHFPLRINAPRLAIMSNFAGVDGEWRAIILKSPTPLF
jgi:hypothetical protein